MPGYNLRASEMQAALGAGQLETLQDRLMERSHQAQALVDGLAGHDGSLDPFALSHRPIRSP